MNCKHAILLILQDQEWHASSDVLSALDSKTYNAKTTHHTQRISELIDDGFDIDRKDRLDHRDKNVRHYRLNTDPSCVHQYIKSKGKIKPNSIVQSDDPTIITPPIPTIKSCQAGHNYQMKLEV